MVLYEIDSDKFRRYGRIIKIPNLDELLSCMSDFQINEGVVYEPSVDILENNNQAEWLKNTFFGELEIQIGYCIGKNNKLNAVEYHRCSEINIAATNMVLILGCQQDITDDYTYDTSMMEAFIVPAGCAVELFATTLHYAPCSYEDSGFKVMVVLPKGTNEPLDMKHSEGEDALLAAKNKWLIGHPDAELPKGTYIGLTGENLIL